MDKQLELLAPARNCVIGIAAIDCGADAVYIAGPAFGARQAAGNNIEDIRRLCDYAHRFGARIFATLNTILYDGELPEARRLLHDLKDAGTDAVIVQDLAVAVMAAEDRLGIPLHASTQCAIRTPEQAAFYERLGFSRLVLERELSLDAIRTIRKTVGCELEVFVHGALCVCYSGQCYLSEKIAGRSANRGACIQACRSRYDLIDDSGHTVVKDKALLSLKDLNLKDRLEELADAGVTSFKIEGRLKNGSYVKNIVRDYSLALDRIVRKERPEGHVHYCRASFGKVEGGFTPDADKTFNRGYTSLFLDGKRGKWASMDSAKSMGEEIGTVSFVSKDRNMLRINPRDGKKIRLNNGDGFSFVAGHEVIGFRGDICSGTEIRCSPTPALYIGARLFRNFDSAFEKELEKNMPRREIGVTLNIGIQDSGEAAGTEDRFLLSVTAESEDGRIVRKTFSAGSQKADNRERMAAMIQSQMGKSTAHYRFAVAGISAGNIPVMPASMLNGIRRNIAEHLDSIPCNRRPMSNCSILECRPDEKRPEKAAGNCGIADYRCNIANSLARNLYMRLGADVREMAYETSHPAGAELMRTKYCVRHELGLCPKQGKGIAAKPMYLMNNGRRLVLNFDCASCEMTVTEPQISGRHPRNDR